MSDPVRPAALLPGDMPSRWRVWRTWLLRTFPGRALVLGLAIKVITWPLGFVITLPAAIDAIDMVGSLALLFAIAYGITRFAVWSKRRLLWRVRRKLILSYVFVGVVPALLVITFFLLAGLILAFNVSSYLVQSRDQEPDRPGALPRADGAARSAARRQRRGAGRSARSPAVEHRDALPVHLDRGGAGRESQLQGGAGAGRARAEGAAVAAAGRGGRLATSAAAERAAEMDRLRRIQRPDRLQRRPEREQRSISRRKPDW